MNERVYRHTLDFDFWSRKNVGVEIYAIHTEKAGKLNFEFDVMEGDFIALADNGFLKSTEGHYILRDDLTKGQIDDICKNVGILWV